MAERDDDFLARWSRRKTEARSGPKPSSAEGGRDGRETAEQALPDGARDGERSERTPDELAVLREDGAADASTRYEGFDFESLDYDSDYTQFMQKDVPDAVRRRALRALWQSDPILANLDGLNDYDEDFTDAALAVDVLKTAYQVGRGYMTDEDREGDDAEQATDSEAGPDAAIGPREQSDSGARSASGQDADADGRERLEPDETT